MPYMIENSTGIRRQLQRRAPSNSVGGPGPYRRFPGYSDDGEEEESSFYQNTVCLIQSGLAGESAELLAKFLKPVVALHRMVSWECPTILQAFGGPGEVASFPTVIRQRSGIERKWAESLLELSGTDAPQVLPVQIPTLLSPQAAKQIPRKSRLDKKDLILVLGKKGQFEFSEELAVTVKKFKKQIVIGEFVDGTILVNFDAAPGLICQ